MRDKNYLPMPENLDDAMRLCKAISDSQMIPKCYQGKPADVFVGSMWAHSLGIPIIQGLQGIAVINGKATIWGDMALGLVRSSGNLEYFKEEFLNLTDEAKEQLFAKEPNFKIIDKITARCTVKRIGFDEVQYDFTIREVRNAGLFRKQGPWFSYPLRMLRMRARSFALRDAFTDILQGLSVTEELIDEAPFDEQVVNGESVVSSKKPARKSKTSKPVALEVETAQPELMIADQSNEPNPLEQMMASQLIKPASQMVHTSDPAEVVEALPAEKEMVEEIPSEIRDQISEVEDQVGMIDDVESLIGYYRSLKPVVQVHVKDIFAKRRHAIETVKVK